MRLRSRLAVGAGVVLAAAGAMGLSKYYWGYALMRPALVLPGPAAEARCASWVLLGLEAREARPSPSADREMRRDDVFVVPDPYESGSRRVLEQITAAARRTDCDVDTARAGLLRALEDWSARLPVHDGYWGERRMGGVLVAFGPPAAPRYFFGGGTPEIQNDHHASVEISFDRDGKVLHSAQWFFDIAGLEGHEMPVLTVLLAFPSVAAGLGLSRLAGAIRRRRLFSPPK